MSVPTVVPKGTNQFDIYEVVSPLSLVVITITDAVYSLELTIDARARERLQHFDKAVSGMPVVPALASTRESIAKSLLAEEKNIRERLRQRRSASPDDIYDFRLTKCARSFAFFSGEGIQILAL